jgi:hypothetical protein
MPIYCHKNMKRVCDEACAAFREEETHGTHCIDLSSQIEVSCRMKNMQSSTDLNSFYTNILAKAMSSFQSTLASIRL